MSVLYDFPRQTDYGRVLPKSKIYEHATPSTKVKSLFVREVEKIVWLHKLSPETLNLPVAQGVHEIQVIRIMAKEKKLHQEILQTIDKAIPSPILFELNFQGKARYLAAYKRISEADKNKWVTSNYFQTDWIPVDSAKAELPVALNLFALYQKILKRFIALPIHKNETLEDLVLRAEQLESKEREAVKLEVRLHKEKQFHHKVEINAELRKLRQEIESLRQ